MADYKNVKSCTHRGSQDSHEALSGFSRCWAFSFLEEALVWNLAPRRSWLRVVRTERTRRCPEGAWEGVCQIFIPASQCSLP